MFGELEYLETPAEVIGSAQQSPAQAAREKLIQKFENQRACQAGRKGGEI
jgi:hypothetical protein